MTVAHLSDVHSKWEDIKVPEVDLLLFTGDIAQGRTNIHTATQFLNWFESQPAKCRVMIAGNHDHVFSKQLPLGLQDVVANMLHRQQYQQLQEQLTCRQSSIVYLEDSTFEYEGLKIHGMPWTPNFHSDYWVFNADVAGMRKHLGQVPTDTDILLSHGPAYGYMDLIPESYKQYGEDEHRGCKDTLKVIKNRLLNLKLFAFGHIHQSETAKSTGSDNYGVRMVNVSNSRKVLFSNGACVDNGNNIVCDKPLIINL